jgi:trigger factor
LKIETTPREDHQVTLVVEIEPAQMESAKHRAARRISERRTIPGFRPGKAPYDVVTRVVGEGAIKEQAVDLLLDEIYPEALKEASLEPAAAGSLEKMDDLDQNAKFTFTVPLAPTVDLGDYRSIRLPYEWKEPGEDQVDAALEDLRQMYSKTEAVNRPVAKGDFTMVDLKGSLTREDAGSQPPAFERSGFPVFVRQEKKNDEWPFPGFSDELVGMNAGENRTFTHTFPKDAADEKLQGQPVLFEVKLKMVRGAVLPELNDEFAKQVGPFENLKALREAMNANLATQSKSDYDDRYYADLIDKIKAGATIKYASQTLDHELEHVMEDLKASLAQQSMDLTAFLKSREMDEEKFIAEEARPTAVKRLERSLILDEFARAEELKLDKEIVNDSFQQTMGELQADRSFQKSLHGRSQPPKQVLNAVAIESANRAYVRQTLDRMKALATGQLPETAATKPASGEVEKAQAPGKTTAVRNTPARRAATAKKPTTTKKAASTARKPRAAKKSASE